MKSGIYKITNRFTKKVYIGLSTDVEKRMSSHKSSLRGNRHINKHLQNSWNICTKHGEDESVFTFEVIEYCDPRQLPSREIYWIEYYKSDDNTKGYNMTPGGYAGTRGMFNGNSNKTIFKFYHISGIDEECTIQELIGKYNIKDKNHIYSITTNDRKSCEGWYTDKQLRDSKLKSN